MKKTTGQITKEKILKAGLELYPNITLEAVARKAGLTSHQVILYHFPKGSLKPAIIDHAVETKNSKIIVQLMAADHAAVKDLSASERIKHFNACEN